MSSHRIAIKKKIKESIFNSVVKRYLIEQEDTRQDMLHAYNRYGEGLFDNTTRVSRDPLFDMSKGDSAMQQLYDLRSTSPSFTDDEALAARTAARSTPDSTENNSHWVWSIPPLSAIVSAGDLPKAALRTGGAISGNPEIGSMLDFLPRADHTLLTASPYAIDAASKAVDYQLRRWPSPYGYKPPQLADKLWKGLYDVTQKTADTVSQPWSRARSGATTAEATSGRNLLQRAASQLDPRRPSIGLVPRINDPYYVRDLLQIPGIAKTSWSRTPQLAKGLAKGAIAPIVGGLAGELLKDKLENAGVFDWYGEKVREKMQQTQDLSPTLGAIHQGSAEAAGRVGAAAENLLLNLDPVNAAYDIAGETKNERYWREKLRDEGQAQSFWDDPLMYSIRASQETTENSARRRLNLPTGSIGDRVAGDNELWKRDMKDKYPEIEKQREWERQQREANRKQDEQEQKERDAKREQEQIQRERMPSGDALDLLRRKESQANY